MKQRVYIYTNPFPLEGSTKQFHDILPNHSTDFIVLGPADERPRDEAGLVHWEGEGEP